MFHPLPSGRGGSDASLTGVLAWYSFLGFCLIALSAFIFKWAYKADKNPLRYLGVIIAFGPILIVGFEAWTLSSLPSQAQAVAACKAEVENWQRTNHEWIESEQRKQKSEHPEYYTEEGRAGKAAAGMREDQTYLHDCANTLRLPLPTPLAPLPPPLQ